ncbi:MAG TPA: N-acetylglucosamine-6-phosphate deacetylase [Caulobacteraceae bacterium]|jgi:N-acetylglucosamine-6-phosphate deacetylase|nr:N-acetylglucosamine-6-phosphate deacetylase [Caulobacteraceae bacterium]
MAAALVNGQVMIDDGLAEGLAVVISGETIAAVVPERDLAGGTVRIDLDGGLLLPGFIDTQVNGGGGVLFNDSPTPGTIARIGVAHRRFGTTGFLPTLISDDLSVVGAAIDATRKAMAQGTPGVLGVHIEGPFLNSEQKGIHDAGKLRRMDEAGLALLASLGAGRTLVTLAPEMAGTAMIQRLVGAGVIVSAGHTNASCAQTRAALEAGMSGFTHLFNAMSPLTSREPGVVGAALADEAAWCGIIVDGRHVDPVVLQIALKCRPLDRFVLVTDAMPCVGTDLTSFTLQNKLITVRDGACFDARGRLAGSDLDMASAVRNAVSLLGLGVAQASRMASRNPAEFLGLGASHGRIAPGYRADLVLLDEALEVDETWIAGRPSAGTPARAAHAAGDG